VQEPPLVLAALDPEGHPLAEIGELADLDRGAERARAKLEAQPSIAVARHRLDEADDGDVEPPSARSRRDRAPAAAGYSRGRPRRLSSSETKRACGRRAGCRAAARSGFRARDIRGSRLASIRHTTPTGPPSLTTKSNSRSILSRMSSIAASAGSPSSGTRISARDSGRSDSAAPAAACTAAPAAPGEQPADRGRRHRRAGQMHDQNLRRAPE
jgi:hypothetical protein